VIDRAAETPLTRFRGWLFAASIYNLAWGIGVILFPDALFALLRLPPPRPAAFWQVVGMFVLVYAPAYAWAARRPAAHAHLVLVGALGKTLGPAGLDRVRGASLLQATGALTHTARDVRIRTPRLVRAAIPVSEESHSTG
jgi:hypothetical protein